MWRRNVNILMSVRPSTPDQFRLFSVAVSPGGQNKFRDVLMSESTAATALKIESTVERLRENLQLREHNFNRNQRREFGPAAYGAFSAKNAKATRGVRGKTFSIRISDAKWRYPKTGGRH